MVYFLIFVLVMLAIWIFLIWLRKTMWDAVHRNLLYLEDELGGKVQRAGFASRPYYSGTYKKNALTINFSTERTAGKRLTYVDISLARTIPFAFTVAEKTWLENQSSESPDGGLEIQGEGQTRFYLRPAGEKKVQKLAKNKKFIEALNRQPDMAYLFAGNSSMLFEFITEEVIDSSTKENLMQRLAFLDKISEVLN